MTGATYPGNMLKNITKLILAIILLIVTFPTGHALSNSTQLKYLGPLPGGTLYRPFKFIVVADSHFGSGQGNKYSLKTLDYIRDNLTDASFIIHLGDLTETGSRAEYEIFETNVEKFNIPFFSTVGNHESRWQDPTASLFTDAYGNPSYSFDYGGIHFVVLDITYPKQTLGTLDPSLIQWLRQDLELISRNKPTFMFCHQPLGWLPRNFQDSNDEFLELIDDYNVTAVFGGHGHEFNSWTLQGSQFFMAGALMDGSFAEVEVNGTNINVFAWDMDENGDEAWNKRLLETFATAKPSNPLSQLSANIIGDTLHAEFSLDKEGYAYFQINGGYFNDLGLKEAGLHNFTCDISGQAYGVHTLRVKVDTSYGTYINSVEFEKGTENMVYWNIDLGSTIVGKILKTSYNTIIVGTRNGYIHKINTNDGTIQWTFQTDSTWSGGFLQDNRLYFGTASGDIYCIHPETGELRWKKTSVDPTGFATAPAGTLTNKGNLILFPSSSGNLYAVDWFFGNSAWVFSASGAITNTPVSNEDTVFFGSWDGHFYGVSSATGQLQWKTLLGRQVYYSPALDPLYENNRIFTSIAYDTLVGASYMFALDPETGQEIFRTPSYSTLLSPTLPSRSGNHTFPGYILLPDASGNITAISTSQSYLGQPIWCISGDSTLFSQIANLDNIYVTGGYRGVINIISGKNKIDYKVRDSFLFSDPALFRQIKDGKPTYMVFQGDNRGTLWALKVPE